MESYRHHLLGGKRYHLGVHFGPKAPPKYGGLRSFKKVLLVILDPLENNKKALLEPVEPSFGATDLRRSPIYTVFHVESEFRGPRPVALKLNPFFSISKF